MSADTIGRGAAQIKIFSEAGRARVGKIRQAIAAFGPSLKRHSVVDFRAATVSIGAEAIAAFHEKTTGAKENKIARPKIVSTGIRCTKASASI